LIVDKNPGPGQYELPNTLADESKKKAKYSIASKVNLNNTSMMSQSMSVISSPRECAFSVPLMGDPFTPIGFIKPTTTSYGRRDNALLRQLPQSREAQSVAEQMFIDKFLPRTAKGSTRAARNMS